MKYTCPVCNFADLKTDPKLGNHEICQRCDIQFGLDDVPEREQLHGFVVDSTGAAREADFQNPHPLRTRESLWAAWREAWLKGNPTEVE
jgi:hypothetical protein